MVFMTDRELKQRIKQAFLVPEPERKQEFFTRMDGQRLADGTVQRNLTQPGVYSVFENAVHHGEKTLVMSRRAFYLTQLGYIRKRIWLLSALLMVLAVGTACTVEKLPLGIGRGKELLCCVSAVVPLLAVLVIVEVNRSFTYGMNELEMSTRHNLLEVYLARGIFMGIGNFLWMLLALLLLVRESQELLIMLGIYLMVPYLFTTILALEIARYSRKGSGTVYCVAAACMVSAGCFFIQGQGSINLYEDRYRMLWIAGFLILLYLTGKKLAEIKSTWEEQLCS